MKKVENFENLVGKAVDIAPFGEIRYWTGSNAHELEWHSIEPEDGIYRPVSVPEQGGLHIGIQWLEPRQFKQVSVQYEGPVPDTESTVIEYWHHNWPPHWAGGWTAIDDPHNGRWVRANGDVRVDGTTVVYTFDPLDFTEIGKAKDFAVFYRQSYRFRLRFKGDLTSEDIAIKKFEVISRTAWDRACVEVKAPDAGEIEKVEVRNGYLLNRKASGDREVLDLLFTDCTAQHDDRFMPIPPDRTVVTIQGKHQTFTFTVEDALNGRIFIPDMNVEVISPEMKERSAFRFPKPIYDMIPDELEQSYERASAEIPQLVKTKQNRYVPLGCDENRQEFALRFNGHVYIDKEAMKASGRDTAKLLFPGQRIDFRFPTMDPPDFREREVGTTQWAMDGYLPIYTSEWKDREVLFQKTDFSALLEDKPGNQEKKRGDEPTCLFSRVVIRNTSEVKRTARFWMIIEQPEELAVKDGFVYSTGRLFSERIPWHLPGEANLWTVQPYEKKRLRAQLETNGKGQISAVPCAYEPFRVTSLPNAIAYDIELEPRASHSIDIKIPFITFQDEDGRDIVSNVSFDAKLKEMKNYWNKIIGEGSSIDVPAPHVNEFTKATIPHVAITVDKDIKTGYCLVPAGTYSYNVCANEAMHQVRALDLRGHHERARRYLMPFIHCQGSRPMHGKFKTQHGVLHGLRVDEDEDYQTFNYNLDHGFVLFSLCEHFFLTRDEKWAKSIAQNIIDACDFVTREREYTKKTDTSGEKVPEYGLIPPGHLEDNPEWLYWYAVNGYCYRGMAASVKLLEEIGHKEAKRIKQDTKEYRDDLRRSMQLHMERSPVTELQDGSYIPFTPTRAELYSRDLGWIRNSLYGPLHTVECGVIDPLEDQATWMLKDTEDNVYTHKYRGRQVDLERYWFSQGGNTIQSGLVPMAMIYLKRDQPEHAIRCLFNAFAQNLYPDVHCFTEHPVDAFGLGVGPFYKTPDECCWINWLRHILLMEKDYESLILAPATPREWLEDGKKITADNMATYFGPVSYEITSKAAKCEIKAVVSLPRRNPPKHLEIRLRHPEKAAIKSVTVDGEVWKKVDKKKETICLDGVSGKKITIVAKY